MGSSFTLISCGKSDVGHVRTNNEDVFRALDDYRFYALADGIGGSPGGEIAAHEAVFFACSAIEEYFLSSDETPSTEELLPVLSKIIGNASDFVYRLGQKNHSLQGMGTTLCAVLFSGSTLIHGHIGDSRLYRLREETLSQLTVDHSLYNKLILEGQLSEAEARVVAPSHILSQAVGTHLGTLPEIGSTPVLPGDRYLLCSDGLSDYTPVNDIETILALPVSPEERAEMLIEVAKRGGGGDNITVLLIDVEPRYADIPRP